MRLPGTFTLLFFVLRFQSWMAPAMQVIRPGFFPSRCRKSAGLNARWTRALVRRLSIPVKSGFGYARSKKPHRLSRAVRGLHTQPVQKGYQR